MGEVTWDEALKLARAQNLSEMKWRHHSLGMLQGEISLNARIHIWHPELVIPGPPRIHDHRFHLTSHVLHGSVMDIPFAVTINPKLLGGRGDFAPLYEIAHAKIQEGHGDAVYLGLCDAEPLPWTVYKRGDTYEIPTEVFHLTKISQFAVTLVERHGFREEPARVVNGAASGIVPRTSPGLVSAIVSLAYSALHSEPRVEARNTSKG